MRLRLRYAKRRLSIAIERFLGAQDRRERVIAARWVTAWAMLAERVNEQCLGEQLPA